MRVRISFILLTSVSWTPACLAQNRSTINVYWMNGLMNEWTSRKQPMHLVMAPRPEEKVWVPVFFLGACAHLCPLWLLFCREWHHSTGRLSTTSLNTPKCCWRRGQTPPLWIKTLKRLSTGQSRWEIDQWTGLRFKWWKALLTMFWVGQTLKMEVSALHSAPLLVEEKPCQDAKRGSYRISSRACLGCHTQTHTHRPLTVSLSLFISMFATGLLCPRVNCKELLGKCLQSLWTVTLWFSSCFQILPSGVISGDPEFSTRQWK